MLELTSKLSTAKHEYSAAIYGLRETSNLLSIYSGGGILPNNSLRTRLARRPGLVSTQWAVNCIDIMTAVKWRAS